MTTFDKSVALWVGGGAIGFFAALCLGKQPILGAALGSVLVGAVGDKLLEERERELLEAARRPDGGS